MATNSFQELYAAYGARKRVCIFAGDDKGNYFGFVGLITKFDMTQNLQEAVTASIEIVPSRGGWLPQWVKGTGTVDPETLRRPFSLGLDCDLKYSLVGMDDTEPPLSGAKTLPIKDLSWSDSMGTTDSITDRTAGGFVQRAATLRDLTLSGTLVYDMSEAAEASGG